MSVRKLAALAAALSLGGPLFGVSVADATTMLPATVQAACLSACLDRAMNDPQIDVQGFTYDPSLGILTTMIALDGDAGGGGFGAVSTTSQPGLAPTRDPLFTEPRKPAATLEVVAAQPAPEPAAWALMILGFGGLGALQRNRRRAAV